MLAITNAMLIFPEYMMENGTVLIKNGKILDYGYTGKISIPDGCRVIDAGGKYLGPGLIDIHTHAGGDYWFYEEPLKAARAHLMHGTTSLLPTVYFNATREQLLEQIEHIKENSKKEEGRIIRGLYMEAPYLNPKFGADRENNPWKKPVDPKDYMELIEAAGDFAKVWCLAPERENIETFVKDVKTAIPDIVFSVAHSEASPYEIERLMPYGLKLATHHTNATGDLQKYPECRGVSVDETVNYNDEIYAELICDRRGIHVDPYMLRMVLKIKGKNKIILISDACVFDGPVPEGYEGVTDINFDHQGEIAGSKLTLDVACYNMMLHTGSSLCDVFKFASTNPAKLLGFNTKGRIEKGFDADLILVDDKMSVNLVILQGEIIQ
ncbi:MAG: amidohydrolase family protein [Clostridiales bacterium]|nr:amidohydrolase family protein [Clostridiales bacterium]